jgi:hypothetical protein
MERVAEYRHMECGKGCVGLVAVADCRYLGKIVYLRVEDQLVGPVRSVDCGNAKHRKQQEQRGLVAELSWPLWNSLDLPMRPVEGELLTYQQWRTWQRALDGQTGSCRGACME